MAGQADRQTADRKVVFRVNSLLGMGLVIVGAILAAVLYLREARRFVKISNNKVTSLLDILLIPLVILFAVLIVITFA